MDDVTLKGKCEHKTVFPVEKKEWFGLVLFAIVMALCNVAGIGGGGIANPMLQLFFVFSTKSAVAVSSCTIFCCSLLRLAYNWKDKHPEK